MSIPNVGGTPQIPGQGSKPPEKAKKVSKEAEVFKSVQGGKENQSVKRPFEAEKKVFHANVGRNKPLEDNATVLNLADEINDFFDVHQEILEASNQTVKSYKLEYGFLNLEEGDKLKEFCSTAKEKLANSKVAIFEFDDGIRVLVRKDQDTEGFEIFTENKVA